VRLVADPSFVRESRLNESLPLHQCHFGADETFGFCPTVDELLPFGLFVVREGRRGGGGGGGGFELLPFTFPVCKVIALFDVDARDCAATSFFFGLVKVCSAGSPILELNSFRGGRWTELDFCLPAICRSVIFDPTECLPTFEGPSSSLILLFVPMLMLLEAFGVPAFLTIPTVVVAPFSCVIVGLVLLGVLTSIFRTLSLVTDRLSPVEGRCVVVMSALPLLTARLSEVDGRRGVSTSACFLARSVVTGCLSAVEGRRGVETSAGFFMLSLAIRCRSPTEGRCEDAEEGLLTPVCFVVSLFLSVDPDIL
jgi:hypothetical protein